MKESDKYLKIVEWFEEDQCYVGSCPGLFWGGCHGHDEFIQTSASFGSRNSSAGTSAGQTAVHRGHLPDAVPVAGTMQLRLP